MLSDIWKSPPHDETSLACLNSELKEAVDKSQEAEESLAKLGMVFVQSFTEVIHLTGELKNAFDSRLSAKSSPTARDSDLARAEKDRD